MIRALGTSRANPVVSVFLMPVVILATGSVLTNHPVGSSLVAITSEVVNPPAACIYRL